VGCERENIDDGHAHRRGFPPSSFRMSDNQTVSLSLSLSSLGIRLSRRRLRLLPLPLAGFLRIFGRVCLAGDGKRALFRPQKEETNATTFPPSPSRAITLTLFIQTFFFPSLSSLKPRAARRGPWGPRERADGAGVVYFLIQTATWTLQFNIPLLLLSPRSPHGLESVETEAGRAPSHVSAPLFA